MHGGNFGSQFEFGAAVRLLVLGRVEEEIVRQCALVQLFGQSVIALPQQIGSGLRLPVAREDALLVAPHAGVRCKTKRNGIILGFVPGVPTAVLTLSRLEIGKVPHELPDEEVLLPEAVEGAEVPAEDLRLVVLGPNVGRQLWAGNGNESTVVMNGVFLIRMDASGENIITMCSPSIVSAPYSDIRTGLLCFVFHAWASSITRFVIIFSLPAFEYHPL